MVIGHIHIWDVIHVCVCSIHIADSHSRMLNVTARLAIEIKNLPHWVIDWTDNTPQRDPASLTISDLLPSEADGQELNKRAVQHVMSILVEEFSSISYLAALIPPEDSPHKACKSRIVPMKLLFKDEKYKSQTTEILDRLAVDAQLSGKPEVYTSGYYMYRTV